jgi:hypothetical protein
VQNLSGEAADHASSGRPRFELAGALQKPAPKRSTKPSSTAQLTFAIQGNQGRAQTAKNATRRKSSQGSAFWKNLLRPLLRSPPPAGHILLRAMLAAELVLWSWRRDSNPRPSDYKSDALPTELRQQLGKGAPPRKLIPRIPSRCPGQLYKVPQRQVGVQPTVSIDWDYSSRARAFRVFRAAPGHRPGELTRVRPCSLAARS